VQHCSWVARQGGCTTCIVVQSILAGIAHCRGHGRRWTHLPLAVATKALVYMSNQCRQCGTLGRRLDHAQRGRTRRGRRGRGGGGAECRERRGRQDVSTARTSVLAAHWRAACLGLASHLRRHCNYYEQQQCPGRRRPQCHGGTDSQSIDWTARGSVRSQTTEQDCVWDYWRSATGTWSGGRGLLFGGL
jgi:hypothetical protein